MFSILLKKALPFTLTFALGAALSGLAGLFGLAGERSERVFVTHGRDHGGGYGRRACRMRAHKLVAESTPLTILFKPDARQPRGAEAVKGLTRARVNVTFGADGRVQEVAPAEWPSDATSGPEAALWASLERAARQIRFTPETFNGMPVSVTREVEIRFLPE
jgi:hypothetical protein